MNNEIAWKIYNNVDFKYHICNHKLYKICDMIGISLKDYYKICKQLDVPVTTKKILKIDDNVLYLSLKENDI